MLELASLADTGELIELSVKPNFRTLGRRFGGETQAVASAIAAVEPTALVTELRAGTAVIVVGDRELPITEEDVVVTESPRSGWAVSSGGADTVALDLELNHELRLLGLIRDIVRLVQDSRKEAGFDVTDRIALAWQVGGSPAPAEAIRTHERAAGPRGAGGIDHRRRTGRCHVIRSRRAMKSWDCGSGCAGSRKTEPARRAAKLATKSAVRVSTRRVLPQHVHRRRS